MAGLKRCVGVDLGDQSVKLVEMAFDKAGLRIVQMVSAPVPIEPGVSDSERVSAQASIVRELIKTNKIATKQAVFCMPGQTVLVRHLRLPRASGPRLHQIVHFEARQVIPFPLEKTMLQYQVFDTESENEIDVLLVAMKKETNEEFMRQIRHMGLRPVGVGIASLALFNGQEIRRFDPKTARAGAGGGGLLSLSFGKGDKAKKPKKEKKKKKGKKDEAIEGIAEDEAFEASEPGAEEDGFLDELDLGVDMGFEEVRAYVNLGARATDLAVCKAGGGNSIGFVRPIPIGGNHITNAIYKECGSESFAQAEQLKRERTAVLSGQFEFEGDQAAYDDAACKAATAVCDRIIAEIRRSLDYYVSQPDGTAVDLMVLSGGGARLPYLTSYIEERLGVPVEISTTLGNDKIQCPAQYGEDFDCAPYKVAIGLAAQGLGISPLDIDFLPGGVQGMREAGGQYIEFAALAAMVAAMVYFGYQMSNSTVNALEGDIRRFQSAIEQKAPQMREWESARAERAVISEKIGALEAHAVPRDFWLRFLARIQELKPPEVLITNIACQPDYGADDPVRTLVRIEGQAETQAPVGAQFVNNLNGDAAKNGAEAYVKSAAMKRIYNRPSNLFRKEVQHFEISVIAQDTGDQLLTQLFDYKKAAEEAAQNAPANAQNAPANAPAGAPEGAPAAQGEF